MFIHVMNKSETLKAQIFFLLDIKGERELDLKLQQSLFCKDFLVDM